jgi:magnesium chelatase family protein
VRSAIKNSGFEIPATRITINLAPADLKKEGSGFDLPIAIGILGAYGALQIKDVSDFLLVGELGGQCRECCRLPLRRGLREFQT